MIVTYTMSYKVYLLKNNCGTRYIGITDNVERRLKDHNDGISRWTASRRPWELIWQSCDLDLGDARRLENRMKRQKGGAGLEAILGDISISGS
jgi:predicted GIY-YIG superfamily endonuclease